MQPHTTHRSSALGYTVNGMPPPAQGFTARGAHSRVCGKFNTNSNKRTREKHSLRETFLTMRMTLAALHMRAPNPYSDELCRL